MKTDRLRDSEDHLTEAALDASPAKLFPGGAVLVVTRSGILAHTLPVAVAEVPVTVNQDLKALVPSPGLDSYYLAHALRAHAQQVLDDCAKDGTTVDSIDSAKLLRFELPIAPSAEQVRVTQALDSYFTRLDAAVATLERVQRNLKRYRASVLKAAVEGRLVPTEAKLARAEKRDYEPASTLLKRILVERRRRWEEAELAKMKAAGKTPKDDKWKAKYQEPAAPDTTGLPALPEGWCWATVEQICGAIVDCPHSTPKWTTEGRICVRTTEFLPGRLDLTNVRYVAEATYLERIQRLRPQPGDVLYSREGGILGIACRVPQGVELCMGQRMMLMRTAEEGLSEYLMHVLNGPLSLQRVRRLTGGSASPHLNVGDVRQFPVPLPPLAEAQRIITELNDVQSIAESNEGLIASALQRCDRLRQSILRWAFEGKLVDQDPTDEPAALLLERIQAERATTESPREPLRPRRAARTA